MPKTFLCLAISFFTFYSAFSQTPEKALENVRNNYVTENIFIHYDKGAYVSGETIWFKAYIMAGAVPSIYSSSINVSLLNDSGKVVETKILPVINSAATGEFTLPRDLKQGSYTVTAYTKRLVNFGNAFFYSHAIPIYNPTSVLQVSKAAFTENLYFMPEGGNIIGGINNNIAFKSVDRFGFPVPVAGEVSDSKGTVVAVFEAIHDGMGKFQIVAQTGERYTASVVFNNSEKRKFELPIVKISGSSIQVLQGDKKIHVLVNREKVSDQSEAPAFILGVINNEVVFRNDLPLSGNARMLIPSDKLTSGIMQLTLFTKENKPLSERLLFINNDEFYIKGKFLRETISLNPRGKNQLAYALADTMPGTFSVSVTDLEKELISEETENIIARNMLSGHLKGYIHNPAYYFRNNDAKTKFHIDLLMLTHGWRRYNWDQVLNAKLPVMQFKDDDYITVKGTAYNAVNNKPLKNTSLTGFIALKDSTNEFITVPVDEEGKFELTGLLFQDSAKFFFQNSDPKNRAAFVQMGSHGIRNGLNYIPSSLVGFVKPTVAPTPKLAEDVKNLYTSAFENDSKILVLKNVQLASVRAKSKEKVMEDKYVTNKIFAGGSHTTLDFVNDPPKSNLNQNVFEYLKGRLSSVNISGSMGNYFLNFRGARGLVTGPIPMAIFLDEQEITTQQASTINLSEVAMIKVLGTGFVGVSGSGGALAIYMKKGADFASPTNTFVKSIGIEGYSPTKEFFSPDYALPKNNTADLDNRSTIYWDPYLESNSEKRKLVIPFYNSDKAKKLRVVLTGFTADGKLLYVENVLE